MDKLSSAVRSEIRSDFIPVNLLATFFAEQITWFLLQTIFDQFARELETRSMQTKIVTVEPKADDHGIVGQQHDYEGGFVLMAVKRHASPTQWHGDVL